MAGKGGADGCTGADGDVCSVGADCGGIDDGTAAADEDCGGIVDGTVAGGPDGTVGAEITDLYVAVILS